MRHLGSLLLTLVLTAAWYVLLGVGLSRFVMHGAFQGTSGPKALLAVLLLLAAGLYSATLLPRLSPVGPVLVGLLLIALGLWALLVTGQHAASEVLPKALFGQRYALELPADYGIAAFAGVPLLLTALSLRRWRRYANPQPAAYPANPPVPVPLAPPSGGYPAPGGYPPPAGYPVPTPPVDPYASPVSPANAGPDGTRVMPAQYSTGAPNYSTPSSGAPSYSTPSSGAPNYAAPNYTPPSSGAPNYSAPSSGAPSYSAPSSGASGYAAPVSGAPNYPGPSSGAPSYPTPSSGAPTYPTPSSGAPNYSTPSAGGVSYTPPSQAAPNYPAPSAGGTSYTPPSQAAANYPTQQPAAAPAAGPENAPQPVWPSGPGSEPDDPDATRQI
jgi:hypothetical protein